MSDAVNFSRCQVQVFSSDSYQAKVLAYQLLARAKFSIFHVRFRFPRLRPFPAFPYAPLCNPYFYTYGNNLIPISVPTHLALLHNQELKTPTSVKMAL